MEDWGRYSREDVLAAVFQDEDSDFEEESSEEGSDMNEEFTVLSGSGEQTQNSIVRDIWKQICGEWFNFEKDARNKQC